MGTSQLEGEQRTMLKFVLPLICVATVAMASMASKKRILRDMSKFNNDVMCWGLDNAIPYYNKIEKACEQCMEFGSNPFHQLQDTFQTIPQSINRGNSMNHVIHKREIKEEEIGEDSWEWMRQMLKNSLRTLKTSRTLW